MVQSPKKRTGRLASPKKQSTKSDWLPPIGDVLLKQKSVYSNFITKNSNTDWFFRVAIEINNKCGDAVQSRQLVKLYIYLRLYMPHGLTGRWAHIRGTDVMNELCSDINEKSQCNSRHALSRSADTGFDALKAWKGDARNWQEAQTIAQNRLDKQIQEAGTQNEKRALGRTITKAPSLLSPSRMMVLLVLAYPGTKTHNVITDLEIGWMMDARETLEVKAGFWRGVNSMNVHKIFHPEQTIKLAPRDMLLDYTRLFGDTFLECRKDIRPHVANRDWLEGIELVGSLDPDVGVGNNSFDGVVLATSREADWESLGYTGSPLPGLDGQIEQDLTPSEPLDLALPDDFDIREYLYPEHIELSEELMEWLSMMMSDAEDGSPFMAWCTHWSERMRAAGNYEDQQVVRSLILQSAARLASCSNAPKGLMEALILLDIGDKPANNIVVESGAAEALSMVEVYEQYASLNQQLIKEVENHSNKLRNSAPTVLKSIMAQQDAYFLSIGRDEDFSDHQHNVILVDKLRTDTIARSFRETPEGIMERDVWEYATMLNATNWQLRALMPPNADRQIVLTNIQNDLYNRKVANIDNEFLSYVDYSTMPPTTIGPVKGGSSLSDPRKEELHRLLIGELSLQLNPVTASGTDPDPGHINNPKHHSDPRAPMPGDPTIRSPTRLVALTSEPSPVLGSHFLTPNARPQIMQSSSNSIWSSQPIFSPSLLASETAQIQIPGNQRTSTNGKGGSCYQNPKDNDLTVVNHPAQSMPWSNKKRDRKASPDGFLVKRRRLEDNMQSLHDKLCGLEERCNQLNTNSQANDWELVDIRTELDSLSGQLGKTADHSLSQLNEQKNTLQGWVNAFQERLDQVVNVQSAAPTLQQVHNIVESTSLSSTTVEKIVQSNVPDIKGLQQEMSKKLDTMIESQLTKPQLESMIHNSIKRQIEEVLDDKLKSLVQNDMGFLLKQELAEVNDKLSYILNSKLQDVPTKAWADTIDAKLNNLQNMLKKPPPALGEPGYLTRYCPSPPSISQTTYENMLLQAVFFYLRLHGDPSAQVQGDGEIMKEVMTHFPVLDANHIAIALRHICLHVYGQPVIE
ncbi:hypothetical protein F4803DRAFT_555966 [Xylaria telfairii]|nr:hypothetical protein F4803DRAFT_555966 [Xylaria telfairii]